MAEHDPIVIVGAARTPMGAFQGALSSVAAPDLGATVIKAAVKKACAGPRDIQEVFMGCVLPAAMGQAPARQAAIKAGLPNDVACTTINKVCGSGMKTVMLAHDALSLRGDQIIVAGGFESMSNAPYLLPKARAGLRLGHGEVKDHMFLDGLENAYEPGTLMGVYAERTAAHYGFSREAQDEFALTSLERANKAMQENIFSEEITQVTVKTRKGEVVITEDEPPKMAQPEKIPNLKPAFQKDGTVTAANSSSIADGAAALVLMRLSLAERRGFKPLAKIVAHAGHAHEPDWFTTAPVNAIKNVFQATGWTAKDVDVFEINEAFAVVTMAAMHELGLEHEKVNIYGGACALGHPIGASGTRIIVTLMTALQRNNWQRGIASLCIGGGEATAIALERISE